MVRYEQRGQADCVKLRVNGAKSTEELLCERPETGLAVYLVIMTKTCGKKLSWQLWGKKTGAKRLTAELLVSRTCSDMKRMKLSCLLLPL